jgi:hypothetical protein
MATLGDLMAALGVRRGPLDMVPREPAARVSPDGQLDIGAIMAGAHVGQTAKSQYEPTLRPGEKRTPEELQAMLWNVVQSAGMESLPGIGPHKLPKQAPGSASSRYVQMRGIQGPDGSEVVGYEWRSKIGDSHSAREGGLVSKRISDWDNSDVSTGTGRDIVHVFHVRRPDGTVTPEGINSASNLLGIPQSSLRTKAKNSMLWEIQRQKGLAGAVKQYEGAAHASRADAARDLRLKQGNASTEFLDRVLTEAATLTKDGKYLKIHPTESSPRGVLESLEAAGWKRE